MILIQKYTKLVSFSSRVKRLFSSVSDSDKYCLKLTKEKDYENYLVGLLFASEYRGLFFAVRAFNIEVATIKDVVPKNSFNAGRFRFQYWRDSLISLNNETSPNFDNQPVLKALRYYVAKHNLSIRWFERAVESRYRDYSMTEPHETIDALETEAELSHSSLNYILLQAMKVDDEQAQYAASHLGVCGGIVTLLRAIPHNSAKGEITLPAELMVKHGLGQSVLLKGPKSVEERKSLQDAVQDLASQAWAHLARAEKLSQEVRSRDRATASVFLSIVAYKRYLTSLQEADFDPFLVTPLGVGGTTLSLQMKLLYAKISGDLSL